MYIQSLLLIYYKCYDNLNQHSGKKTAMQISTLMKKNENKTKQAGY